jgi:hypothetical protein
MSELSETFKRLEQDPQGGSQHLLHMLETFLMPFLHFLDEVLDKRLVRTFVQCLVAIIRLRNNPQALWLSELGSYLQGYDGYASSAAAGTKRVGKLLRSVKWTMGLIDRYLLEKADEEVQKLKEQGKRILCIWDGSVLEKAESEKLEGLCPVLSVPREATTAHQTRPRVQLARPSAHPGHGDAMERRADCRDARASPPGRDEVVDDERGFRDKTARRRRRGIAHLCQEMGSFAGAYI